MIGGWGAGVQPDAPELQTVPPPPGFPNRSNICGKYGPHCRHTHKHTYGKSRGTKVHCFQQGKDYSTEKRKSIFKEALLKSR